MGGLMFLDPGATFRQEADKSREDKRVNGLRALAGDYYGAQDPKLGEIARLGGDAGGMQRDQMQMQERKREQLGEFAGLIANTQDENMRRQLYETKVAPWLQSEGIQAPPYGPQVVGMAQQISAQFGKGRDGMPAGIQEFNYLTDGLSPEDVVKSKRVKLGLDGRAPSGLPFGFMEVVGSDGVTRIIQTNKAEGGAAMIGPGGAPFGAGAGPGAPAPPSGPTVPPMQLAALLTKFGGQMTSGYRDPSHNAKVGGVSNSQHMQGTGQDWVFPGPVKAQAAAFARSQGYEVIDEGDHLHFELPPQSNPYASRPAEQQAALTTAATEQTKADVEAANAPRKSANDAAAAAEAVTAKGRAETTVTAEADLPRLLANGNDALKVINELLLHPGRKTATGLTSKTSPENFIPGTPAYDFRVKADQLKGKAFLEAFNTLKGGGQITEVEGTKATNAIAALDSAQSDEQYAKALRDFSDVIRAGMNRARMKAGRQPAMIIPRPSASHINSLVEKYLK